MRIFKYILISIVFIFLQILLFSKLTILNSIPFIMLPLLIYISINLPYTACMSITFFNALLWDIMYPHLLGLNIIVQVLICHFINKYHQNINKEKIVSVSISVLLVNIVYFLFYWLYYIIAYQSSSLLLLTSVFSIFYNTVTSIAILYLLVLTDKLRIVIYE